MELEKDNMEDVEQITEVTVPNIIDMSVKDARKVLKEAGLELDVGKEEIDESQEIIVNQTPKEGIVINSGSTVYCDI